MADFPLDFFIAVRRGGYSSVTGCVLTRAIRPYGTTKLRSIFGKMKEKRKWPLRGSNPIHQLDIPQPLPFNHQCYSLQTLSFKDLNTSLFIS